MNGLLRQTPPAGRSWIVEGIVLLLIPFIAYTMYYMFRMGYASLFGIPISLMPLGLSSDLIWLTVIIYIIFIYSYLIIRTLTSFFDTPVVSVASKIFLAIKLLPLFLPKILGKKWYALLQAFVGKDVLDKFRRQSYILIALQIGMQLAIIAGIVIVLFIAPYQIGRAYAGGMTTFYTCSVSPAEKLVVLEKYDDILVTAPLGDNKKLLNSFRMIRLSDIPEGRLVLEKLGHVVSR